MIIEVEDRFAKAAQRFLGVLKAIDEAAGRDAPVHEVEQVAWQGIDLTAIGRQSTCAP